MLRQASCNANGQTGNRNLSIILSNGNLIADYTYMFYDVNS